LLIQFATTSYLLTEGKTVGFSSILFNVVRHTTLQNFSIVIGLILSALFTINSIPAFIPTFDESTPISLYLLAGALTGFGTKFGCGCTSGHMINGLSRFRIRSVVATAIFSVIAMITTSMADLGSSCGAHHCYEYDPGFPLFNKTKSQLVTILTLGFINSYIVLPYLTSRMSSKLPKLISLANGVNTGVLFGLGLIISGMAQPSKTLGFLSVFNMRKFDPSLALIIVFTILPNAIIWNTWVLPRGVAISSKVFDVSNANGISKSFILGNVLFGLGWGILGVCPGPGILGVVFNGYNGIMWLVSFLVFYNLASVV